ncbi:MAG: hypothetical protein KDJ52_25510 [Anaerolineae bacterium]|nr:hypothetical protein [Anaerolineae bacterium]
MTGRVKVEAFNVDIIAPIDSKLAHSFLPATAADSFVLMELLPTVPTPHTATNGVQFSLPLSRLVEGFIFYAYALKLKTKKATYHLIAYGLSPILGANRCPIKNV